jgi:opacity protein-like surface antigen
MRRLRLLALFAALISGAPAALAADFIRPMPLAYTGWYVRADIGFKWYGTPSAIFDAPTFGGGFTVPGNGELFEESMSQALSIGGGVGVDPAGALRLDFTIDYETPSHFYGRLDCPACGGGGYSEEQADIMAWAGLFNVYWDFERHPWHLKPYVGAGAGFSILTTFNVATNNPGNTVYPGATHWNFAWGLMAGATKDLTVSSKLDLGYRFLYLGEARSGVIADGLGATGYLQYQNIHAHEFRIGLRYML